MNIDWSFALVCLMFLLCVLFFLYGLAMFLYQVISKAGDALLRWLRYRKVDHKMSEADRAALRLHMMFLYRDWSEQ